MGLHILWRVPHHAAFAAPVPCFGKAAQLRQLQPPLFCFHLQSGLLDLFQHKLSEFSEPYQVEKKPRFWRCTLKGKQVWKACISNSKKRNSKTSVSP